MSININPQFTFNVNSFNSKSCNHSNGISWDYTINCLTKLVPVVTLTTVLFLMLL